MTGLESLLNRLVGKAAFVAPTPPKAPPTPVVPASAGGLNPSMMKGLAGAGMGSTGGLGAAAMAAMAAAAVKAVAAVPPGTAPATGSAGGLGAGAMGALGAFGGTQKPHKAAVVSAPATGLASLTGMMNPLAGGINKVQQAFAGVAGTASKVATSFGLVTEPLKALVGTLGSFRDSITALGNQVSQFTRLANPALTAQFAYAADDFTASIGKGLIPVLQFATKYARMFGDAMFTLAGPLASALDSGLKPLGDLIPTLTNTIGPVVRGIGTLIRTIGAVSRPLSVLSVTLAKIIALPLEAAFAALGAAFEALTAPIEVAAILLGRLADALSKFVDKGIGDIRKLLGLKTMSGASTGAAVRNVSMGGVEEYQKKAFQMAFSLGTAGSADERTAGYAQQILQWLDEEGSKLPNRIVAGLAAIAEKIIKAIPGNPFGPAPEGMNAAERVTAKLPGGETAVKAGRYVEEKIMAQRERGRRGDILGSVTLGLISDSDLKP